MKENKRAWQLWHAIHTQWVVGFGGLVGLNYPAVFQVADILGIKMTTAMLKKMQALEREVLKRQNEKSGV